METTITDSIDFSYLKTVSGGDTAFEQEMLGSLMTEIDEKIKQLPLLLLTGDRVNSRIAVHSLKNLFAILGVASLAELFRQMEADSTNNCSGDHLLPLCRQGQDRWQLVKEQLVPLLQA